MTEQTRRNANEDRCDKCGTIRITFDEPIELTESDEILQDAVWAVYRERREIGGDFFMAIDSLFYTESSAREELDRQIEQVAASLKDPSGGWVMDSHWVFNSTAEVLAVGKVEVKL